MTPNHTPRQRKAGWIISLNLSLSLSLSLSLWLSLSVICNGWVITVGCGEGNGLVGEACIQAEHCCTEGVVLQQNPESSEWSPNGSIPGWRGGLPARTSGSVETHMESSGMILPRMIPSTHPSAQAAEARSHGNHSTKCWAQRSAFCRPNQLQPHEEGQPLIFHHGKSECVSVCVCTCVCVCVCASVCFTESQGGMRGFNKM